MDHYFTNNDSAKSNEKDFQVTVLSKTYTFTTDIGVFSKGELDAASRLLMETWDALNLTGSLLDVGCGYGAMSIPLAAKRPNDKVHMIDVNLRAIELAKKNAIRNNVHNVEVYESSCYENVSQKFDHIISNPPIRAGKKVVHEILAEAVNYLNPQGTLTIVIGKQHGAPSAMKKMEEVFGNVERLEREKGFWILQSIKEE